MIENSILRAKAVETEHARTDKFRNDETKKDCMQNWCNFCFNTKWHANLNRHFCFVLYALRFSSDELVTYGVSLQIRCNVSSQI